MPSSIQPSASAKALMPSPIVSEVLPVSIDKRFELIATVSVTARIMRIDIRAIKPCFFFIYYYLGRSLISTVEVNVTDASLSTLFWGLMYSIVSVMPRFCDFPDGSW